MKLIVGLGNIGDRYANNRHNAGFILIDTLANSLNVSFEINTKMSSLVARTKNFILCKPIDLMNNSGLAVAKLSKFYKVSPENIYVINDDLDLEFGRIKKQVGGGTAGHHGVEDIVEKLGTHSFVRIRFGIGRPENKGDEANYVLNDFSEEELEYIKGVDVASYIN